MLKLFYHGKDGNAMPNKATELSNAIKAVQKAAEELLGGDPYIFASESELKVMVDRICRLEQIPGDMRLRERRDDKKFPWKAYKVFEGVEFCILLTQAEYEAVRLQESA